jgi:hypothetical protein
LAVRSRSSSTLLRTSLRCSRSPACEPHFRRNGSSTGRGFAHSSPRAFAFSGSPFIRTTAALYGLGNFILPGVFLVIIVVGKRQGLAAGEIGGLLAIFGAFLLLGSLLSPLFRRAFSTRAILLLEVWAGVGCAVFLTWTSVYVLAAAVLPQALVMASTDSVVVGYRVAMTPDRLLGRVESIRSTISRVIEPLGPLTAGVLLSLVSARTTIAFFVLFAVVLAGWATLSPAIRNAPSLEDLGTLGPKA